jgi:sensor c-di-GMP phosphodiesterase-like protein
MITKAQFRRAIQREEFIVVYQPIVVLADGRCAGAEVLVRWQRENGALLAPDHFLPAAQRHGYLDAITDLVLAQSLNDMAPTLRAHPQLHLAINIPAQDVNSGRILKVLDAGLAATGVAPAQLWLEITEGSSMETRASRMTLSEARCRGHVIALDDFGTGYSCLRYLHELPCDVLKLDRSFVTGIGSDTPPHPVLGCIIDLAHKLRLAIVAEGVETAAQASYLDQAGVHYAQGWYYARPMLAGEFSRYCSMSQSALALLPAQPASTSQCAPAVDGGRVETAAGMASSLIPLT